MTWGRKRSLSESWGNVDKDVLGTLLEALVMMRLFFGWSKDLLIFPSDFSILLDGHSQSGWGFVFHDARDWKELTMTTFVLYWSNAFAVVYNVLPIQPCCFCVFFLCICSESREMGKRRHLFSLQ